MHPLEISLQRKHAGEPEAFSARDTMKCKAIRNGRLQDQCRRKIFSLRPDKQSNRLGDAADCKNAFDGPEEEFIS
jgi:hypothetical protein